MGDDEAVEDPRPSTRSDDPAEDDPGPLARKLQILFRTVLNDHGEEYSAPAVAEEINRRAEKLPADEAAGRRISPSYVWQLKTGRRRNPTLKHLESLGDFFGIPPRYLLDDEPWAELQAHIDVVTAIRDSGVRAIAFRAKGLSAGAIKSISAMIDHARQLEGLAAASEAESERP